MGKTYRIIQISDLHLLKLRYESNTGIPPAYVLEAILRQIRTLDPIPSAIILSGDISDAFYPDSYYLMDRMMMPMELPYYWLPGNHDEVTVMAQLESQLSVENDKCFQLGNRNIILLNSVIPDDMAGRLSPESLQFLVDSLAANPGMPTMLFLHHHPVWVVEKLEPYKLLNANALFDILEVHPQVEAVFFGHVHVVSETLHAGVRYLSCPPACFPYRQIDTHTKHMIPGYRIIDWDDSGAWNSQVKLLPLEPILAQLNEK